MRIVASLLSLLLPVAGMAEQGSLRSVTLDSEVRGQLRDFQGVSGAPGAEYAGPGEAAVDITPGYRLARVDLIRTHDAFGPGDIDARFGATKDLPIRIPAERSALVIFPDMNADPENAASYHFEATDKLLASIRGVRADIIFRLGRSIGAQPTPPADADKYAAIARHIVLHYNKGWAHGFHGWVRYFEVWNEPDFKVFWTGTPQQYYTLYEKIARAVKSADPAAQVGGSTISQPLDATPYREGFLDFVRVRKLPLDFFSWHFYAMDSNDPSTFADIGRQLRALLDARGFEKTKSVLDEWNADLFDRDLSKAARGAFALAALIDMLDAPIDLQAFYRADPGFRAPDQVPDPLGQALIAFGRMKDTPRLLSTKGGDRDGFAVLAGRSEDARTLQVLISNYEIAPKFLGPRPHGDVMHIPNIMDVTVPPRRPIRYHDNGGYDLSVNLPAGRYRVTRYRITDAQSLAEVDSQDLAGPTLKLADRMPAPGVAFIRIVRQP